MTGSATTDTCIIQPLRSWWADRFCHLLAWWCFCGMPVIHTHFEQLPEFHALCVAWQPTESVWLSHRSVWQSSLLHFLLCFICRDNHKNEKIFELETGKEKERKRKVSFCANNPSWSRFIWYQLVYISATLRSSIVDRRTSILSSKWDLARPRLKLGNYNNSFNV